MDLHLINNNGILALEWIEDMGGENDKRFCIWFEDGESGWYYIGSEIGKYGLISPETLKLIYDEIGKILESLDN